MRTDFIAWTATGNGLDMLKFVGLIALFLTMEMFGQLIGLYGMRRAVGGSTRFGSVRRGQSLAITVLTIAAVCIALSAEQFRALPKLVTMAAPLAILIVSALVFRHAVSGTWSIFGLDIDKAAWISDVRLRLIRDNELPFVLDKLAHQLGSLLTGDPDWRIRRFAAFALKKRPGCQTLSFLCKGLEDTSPRVKLMSFNSVWSCIGKCSAEDKRKYYGVLSYSATCRLSGI